MESSTAAASGAKRWFHGEHWSLEAWLEPEHRVAVIWRAVESTNGYEDEDGNPVADPTKAATVASGAIKWDGCINMSFDDGSDEASRLHFCGSLDASEKLAELFKLIHDAAMALCDSYVREHAERSALAIAGAPS